MHFGIKVLQSEQLLPEVRTNFTGYETNIKVYVPVAVVQAKHVASTLHDTQLDLHEAHRDTSLSKNAASHGHFLLENVLLLFASQVKQSVESLQVAHV